MNNHKTLAWRLAGLALAAATALPAHALQEAAPPVAEGAPVAGLIVQLRDAPSHAAMARKAAAGEAATPTPWARVLRDSGLAARAPQLRPSGRSAQLLRFDAPLSAAEAQEVAERLRRDPAVLWVAPNVRERRLADPPNDPRFPGVDQQWWLQPHSGSDQNSIEMRLRGVADFQNAWTTTTGSPAVPVAVLDTGITAHPELAGRVLPGYDFVAEVEYAGDGDGRDADPSDPGDAVTQADKNRSALFASCEISESKWHGTSIAGLIGAVTNNGDGVAGIHWNARIVPVRVAGKCGASVSDIVDGMRWSAGLPVCKRADSAGRCLELLPANANPVKIVNVSFGGTAACIAAYQQAVDELKAAGVVVVAAAGNEHAASTRPANCSNVVAVAALNRDGFKAVYSNFAVHDPAKGRYGIATVGGDTPNGAWGPQLYDSGLLSITNLGTTTPGMPWYAYLYGTSFAAPLVSGTLALMLSLGPAMSWQEMVAGLALTARPHVTSSVIQPCSDANPGRCLCTAATCGAGILDAAQAVLYAQHTAQNAPYTPPVRAAEAVNASDVASAAAAGADLPANATAAATPEAGGGGGAMGAGWLAALASAALALAFSARRRAGRPPRPRC
jgi:serine protease